MAGAVIAMPGDDAAQHLAGEFVGFRVGVRAEHMVAELARERERGIARIVAADARYVSGDGLREVHHRAFGLPTQAQKVAVRRKNGFLRFVAPHEKRALAMLGCKAVAREHRALEEEFEQAL